MSYSMEAEVEADRLEQQVRQGNYCLSDELRGVPFAPDETVLDAGCGTGVLSRYLLGHHGVKHVTGVDASELRIRQARALADTWLPDQLRFEVQDLSRLDPRFHGQFDTVVCRFVIEHVERPQEMLLELKRALKPGGRLIIIELDGVFVNLSSANPAFNGYMEEFRSRIRFDPCIGRKVPQMFALAGLQEEARIITQLDCRGPRLAEEIANSEQRFAALGGFLTNLFGSEMRAREFQHLYLTELRKPENTLVFQKYVCIARKAVGAENL